MKSTIIIGKNSPEPIEVNRFGYGTMRLTGPEIWGEPADRPQALEVLKTALASGVQFFDTADYYGQDITNRLLAEALYPYPKNIVICTKVGGMRKKDKSWHAFLKPENLRASIDNNLKTLKQERIQLVHLRMFDPSPVPFDEALNAMFDMQKQGKIQHVGLSNVNAEQLTYALKGWNIASVENMYGYNQRGAMSGHGNLTHGADDLLHICEQHEIPLIPFFSLQTAQTAEQSKIVELAKRHNVTTAQLNLAWLLHKSDFILPIPGTSKLQHLKENLDSVKINLTKEEMEWLG